MKRRQRRPVLDINNEQSDSPRGRWQNKYQQIAVDHPEQNGTQINPLASLLGQYNSDSETEDTKQDSNKLNDKVNDFFKEIQMIAGEKDEVKVSESRIPTQRLSAEERETSKCSWQECFDETTGYPYYWHIETNEVTWEMPSEMKVLRDKSTDSSRNVVQTSLLLHPQVQQWANFLPNRYPELQTNIPEGMIPKEVVARNRNRQVGIRKGVQDMETVPQISKKIGPKDEDSDDEKIEMITSFGNDESESETSENDSPLKKPEKTLKSGANPASEKNSELKDEDSLSIGPLLPPGIIPMIHGPENVSLDMRELENKGNDDKETKETNKSADIDEEDILKRLKNQAKLLQSLGGEVPESVETLIKNNNDKSCSDAVAEEEDDIDSQMEKEISVDRGVNKMEDKGTRIKKGGGEEKVEDIEKKKTEFKISLVAGYSDDSETEDEVYPKNLNPQPLFPISDYVAKENSNTGSRDSAAIDGRSLIDNADRKEIEAKSLGDKNSALIENDCTRDSNGLDSQESEENKDNKTTNETSTKYSFFEDLEMPAKGFKRKKRIAFDVVPNKPLRPQTDSSSIAPLKSDSSSPNFSATSYSQDEPERHGFGFRKDQDAESTESTENLATNLEKQKCDADSSSQSKKPIINFVKGETEGEEKPVKLCADYRKPSLDNENTKQLKELTEIITEKVKFLSEGSQSVSAIQVMAIQIQTLVAAWEAGDLRESYLSEWVNGTERELGRLEEAAAPPGWDCHWDRSHKRYYYRNSENGDAQWTYPDADVVGGTEEMDLCTTPPPPEDEELLIIEEKASDESEPKVKETKSSTTVIGENKIIQITKDEYKGIEAPPPPQISSPSPPPPPRIFAEDLKKGKKRRGSNGERSSELKKEKLESDAKESSDPPPLPLSPPKITSQPPLPPNPPVTPNPLHSEPLPPGVDPKDMPYSLQTVTAMESGVVYATGATQQTNPIYAATIGERGAIALPIIDHRSALIQGQLMHYPTYQHLHNQAMIAAAGSLGGQEAAVQFMIADYTQVYANTQVIAKPPVKSQSDHSLGSALDSFYNDIASIEKTNAEQESTSQEFDSQLSLGVSEANSTPPPIIATSSNPVVVSSVAVNETEEKTTDSIAGKEKKRKKTKIGIGKKQKEMSTMVAKWQKAQQDFDDSE